MRLPVNGRITQGFHSAHQAIDIAGAHRSPVYAPHAGKITSAGQMGSGTNDAGLAIDINGGRFVSRLGHNDQIIVSVGQQVAEGQHIGYQGFTGYTQPDNNVQGSHCHWVLWDNGTRVNGQNYITAPQGGEVPMNRDEEANAYQIVLDRAMEHGGSGRTGYKFIIDAKAEIDAKRAGIRNQIANMQTTINQLNASITAITKQRDEATKAGTATKAELQSLMLKEQAELVRLADCVADLETAHDTIADLEKNQGGFSQADRDNQNKILSMVTMIFNYFKGQYKTFAKYITKG